MARARVGMVALALPAILVGGLATAGFGADVNTSKGVWEVIFSFEDWYLGSYNGGVGVRYFVRDQVALRPGIDFSIGDDWKNAILEDRNYMEADTTDSDTGSLGVSFFVEKFVEGFKNVAPFLAVGMAYTFSSADGHENRWRYYEPPEHSVFWSSSSDVTRHQLSLMGALGFQWQFADHLSLGGQYNISAVHTWKHEKSTQTRFDGVQSLVTAGNTDTQGTSVGVDSGRLLLSVRFR